MTAKTTKTPARPAKLDEILTAIASTHLNIASLETQRSSLDYHEVSAAGLKQALMAAFKAGQAASSLKAEPTRRELLDATLELIEKLPGTDYLDILDKIRSRFYFKTVQASREQVQSAITQLINSGKIHQPANSRFLWPLAK